MGDPRYTTLAKLLIEHATRLAPGEHLLIEAFDIPEAMVVALVRAARAVGGHPHVALRSNRILRELDATSDDAGLEAWAACDRDRMARMQAYLGLRGSHNVSEASGIDVDRVHAKGRLYQTPVHFEQRVNHTRWCVLRWPTPAMAQLAGMDTEAFEDFYFEVCTLDYGRMETAAAALQARMHAADEVRLTGPGDTDLVFSIKDVPAIPCCGRMNIPDGECFTAPVRDSINGVIQFNTPTLMHGNSFRNVRLTFADGRVVDADAEEGAEHLPGILDTDEGARHVGEFAIGFNPYIMDPMKDILFDEKIAGSIHLTPGNAYEDADNGNRSEIHWDLVLIQRPEYGGGTMTFDGDVVRRDGLFVVEDLLPLNPDALRGS